MIMAGCSSNFAVAGCANVRKEIVLGNQKTNLIRLSFRGVLNEATFQVLRGECAEEVCLVCGWSIDTGSGWGGKGVGEEESIGEEKACGL